MKKQKPRGLLASAIAVSALPIAMPSQAQEIDAIQRGMPSPVPPITSNDQTQEIFATGNMDLFILTPRKLFRADAGMSSSASDNILMSDANKQHGIATSLYASLGASTLIDETYEVSLGMQVASTRYDNLGAQLNNDSGTIKGSVGRHFGTIWAVMFVQYDSAHQPSFSTEMLGQTTYGISVNKTMLLNPQWLFVPQAYLHQVEASPSEYSHQKYGVSMVSVYQLSQEVSVDASLDVSKREYRNYYESILNVHRQDTFLTANLGTTWRPAENLRVSIGARYSENRSNVSFIKAREKAINPSITVSMLF